MENPKWDAADLSESDRLIGTVLYKGDDASNPVCVCSILSSTCSLIHALVSGSVAIGHFVITENQLLNPIDYSRGAEPLGQFMRSQRFDVYKIKHYTIITFDESISCTHEVVDEIFRVVNPDSIIVLESIHASLFMKPDLITPQIFCLSNKVEDSNYPVPNIVAGISAGLITQSEVKGKHCRVFVVVEDDCGPSIESMKLFQETLNPILPISFNDVSQKAMDLYHLYHNDIGMVYT